MIEWSDKQKSFFANSEHSFNILSGSVSSGKTYISNLRWYRHICESPKNSLLVMIGKTSESLRDNCIRYLMEMDNNFSLDETKMPMRLHCRFNKVDVACAGGDNEKAWQRIQGKTTAGAYFDEATTLPQSLVQNIAKGCRHGGKTWPKFMTCNPDHPSHYIKQRYIDNNEIDKRVWYFGLQDNPSLSPEYIKEVKQLYTGALYERMIEGKWVQSEGVIFNEFNRDIHLFDTIKNTIKEYVVGVDHGWENPLAMILLAVDYDGNYYIVDEIYQSHQHIDDSLKAFMIAKGWFKLSPRISYAYADTNRPDLTQLMNRLFGFPVLSAIKDVVEGIQCVNGFFKRKKLFVHRTKVPNTIRELESYVWKAKPGKVFDEPIKENDHCFVAGTKILTFNGYENIEDLEKGDSVYTPDGFKIILKKHCIDNKKVGEYIINGNKIKCTANHRIFTDNGYKQIKHLTNKDTYCILDIKRYMEYLLCKNKLIQLYIKGLNSGVILKVKLIISILHLILDILKRVLINYIAINMNVKLGQFLKVFTCIIKMVIILIMKLIISLFYLLKNIFQNMLKIIKGKIKRRLWNISKKSDHLQKNGMLLKKGMNGIKNIVKNLDSVNIFQDWKNAKIVLMIFRQKQNISNSVAISANPLIDVKAVLIILLENVKDAIKNLLSIKIQKQNFVVNHAPRKHFGKVYDLTIQDLHCYYANNILVHNSCDSIRYAIFTRERARVRLIKNNPFKR